MKKMLLFIKEFFNYINLFGDSNANLRRIVFYSERGIYYQYFEGAIETILVESKFRIAYITSDPNDPIFRMNNPRIKAFYINEFLAETFKNLDSRVVVLTMPDLGKYHIKRALKPVNHVYLFHGIGSTHLTYQKGAFDQYDTIICTGPHEIEEIRKAEAVYHLPEKKLISGGYHRVEKIFADHQVYLKNKPTNPGKRPVVLIAPSWYPGNILSSCIDTVIDHLAGTAFDVIIRPHPEFIHRFGPEVDKIRRKAEKTPNIRMELDMVKRTSIDEADVLITDWSAISFEYALGTERPVLFINTPMRVDNPDYQELGIEPMELAARSKIGKQLEIADAGKILEALEDLVKNGEKYRKDIIEFRNQVLFNWGESAKKTGEAILELARKKED